MKKKVHFHQDKALSQVDCDNAKTTWIELWIATLFFRSSSQRLLVVCGPQKNAPGKEIWLQWRSDIGNWSILWGQWQIVLQKRHGIVREVLESVYHPRRLLMNKVEFYLKVVLLGSGLIEWCVIMFHFGISTVLLLESYSPSNYLLIIRI